jgi:hypothetical protein
MTRGNQRELARQKNLKKEAEKKKGRDIPEGMNMAAVKTQYLSLSACSSLMILCRDAGIMRQKQALAMERKQKEEEERLAALRASKSK